MVKRARRGGRKVILGGHSLGASMAVAYAAWDFKGRAGFRDLSGLVLIDGGLLGTLAPPSLADVKQRIAALRRATRSSTCSASACRGRPASSPTSRACTRRCAPDARATFVDYPAIPAALKAPVPATNEGALGYAFDESTSPAVLSLIHVRAGALAPSGDPRPWQNGEVTPIENVAKLFGRSPVDAGEWYFPQRLSLDVAGRGRAAPQRGDELPAPARVAPARRSTCRSTRSRAASRAGACCAGRGGWWRRRRSRRGR